MTNGSNQNSPEETQPIGSSTPAPNQGIDAETQHEDRAPDKDDSPLPCLTKSEIEHPQRRVQKGQRHVTLRLLSWLYFKPRVVQQILMWIQAATLIALALYVYFTYGLVKETRRSAALAQEVLEQTKAHSAADLRPWVTVKGVTIANLLAVGEMPVGAVTLYNSGKSPALNVRIAHTVYTGSGLPSGPDIPDFKLPAESSAVVAQGTDFRAEVPSLLTGKMTAEKVSAFKEGKLRCFVFGTITYTGPLGGEFRTDYCFVAIPGHSRGESNFCNRWNTAK